MLHDLGLEKHQITDISAVQQKIDEIDKHFQLVMLAERLNKKIFCPYILGPNLVKFWALVPFVGTPPEGCFVIFSKWLLICCFRLG